MKGKGEGVTFVNINQRVAAINSLLCPLCACADLVGTSCNLYESLTALVDDECVLVLERSDVDVCI